MNAMALREELLERADTAKALPALDSVMTGLLRVMNDEDCSFNQIHDIIKYDQAIS